MKKIFIICGLILLAQFSTFKEASAQTDKKNIIKINILSPVLSTASLFYEREISETISAQLGLFYTGASVDDTRFRGFGITPEVRFYLSDKGTPEGFFVAPYLRYQNFQLKDEATDTQQESEADFNAFGGGVLVGGQWVFKDIISLDVWGGPAYSAGSLDVKTGDEEDFSIGSIDGFGLRFGVTLGVAF